MVTEVTDKLDLDSKKTSLLSDVDEVKSIISSISGTLSGISSYDGLDIGGAAFKLSYNLKNLSDDIDTTSRNISSYVDSLLAIDKDTSGIETVDTTISADELPKNTLTPAKTSNTQTAREEVTISASRNYYAAPSNNNATLISFNSRPSSSNQGTSRSSSYSNNSNYSSNQNNNSQPTTNTGANSQSNETSSATPAVNTGGPVDISKYHNLPSSGFNVTTDNQTYNLSAGDIDILCAIVAAESDQSYDDALAVISVILNRCEAPNWIASHGTNPVRQATAPNQFVVYQHGSYRKYTNGNAPDTVKIAVADALAGVRNHKYLSFRSNKSRGYSNNLITSTGNRYK